MGIVAYFLDLAFFSIRAELCLVGQRVVPELFFAVGERAILFAGADLHVRAERGYVSQLREAVVEGATPLPLFLLACGSGGRAFGIACFHCVRTH